MQQLARCTILSLRIRPAHTVAVFNKQVERGDPLLEGRGSIRFHSSRIEDSRDNVEGPDLFSSRGMAIHAERDAHVEQREIGRRLAALEFSVRE